MTATLMKIMLAYWFASVFSWRFFVIFRENFVRVMLFRESSPSRMDFVRVALFCESSPS